jgi:hypothetical protein
LRDETDFALRSVDFCHDEAVYVAWAVCKITIRWRNGSQSAHLRRRTVHRRNISCRGSGHA